MKMNVLLDNNAYMPQKAYDADAGFDLFSPTDFVIEAKSYAVVDLGVHFEIPKGYVGFLKSKSGLNIHNSIVCEGVIDSGYTGSVVAKLYNLSDVSYNFYKGQKVTQIVFIPIPEIELNKTETFKDTARGNGGFGSTGK